MNCSMTIVILSNMKFGIRKKKEEKFSILKGGGEDILGNMKFGLRKKNKVFNFGVGGGGWGYSGEHEIWT